MIMAWFDENCKIDLLLIYVGVKSHIKRYNKQKSISVPLITC